MFRVPTSAFKSSSRPTSRLARLPILYAFPYALSVPCLAQKLIILWMSPF
jgi:hypothetical protein